MKFYFSYENVTTIFLVLVATISLVSFTADGEILVAGDLLREFTLKPGASYQGEIVVKNPGDEPTGFEVSKSDYLYYADGSNEYPPPESIERSNASWISFSLPPEVTIQPEEEFPLNFEITVPEDPSLVGTYWSTIMIQSPRPPDEEQQEGVGVRQVIRYGVQIAVHIGDTGERKIDLLEVKRLRSDGKKSIQVNVKNVGQHAVSPIARAELYDDSGKQYGPFKGTEYMIYPGCSVSYKVALEDVPDKKYEGVIIIDNGDQYIWGARREINFSSSGKK